MFVLFLIYLTFIGLGLSDSLLGTAWPFMAVDMAVNVEHAGIISIIISIGIIISSLQTWKLTKRMGFAGTAILGFGLLAAALLGFAAAGNLFMVCAAAIPLGLGGGIIQTIFDEYVAEHYSARHMNWLQGVWGIGAVAGPYLVSVLSSRPVGWRGSYVVVAAVEMIFAVLFFLFRGYWGTFFKQDANPKSTDKKKKEYLRMTILERISMSGQFFLYCSMENTIMLWGASYLIAEKGFEPSAAARGVSLFFVGITAGRFLSGMLAGYLNSYVMAGGSILLAVFFNLIVLLSGDGKIVLLAFLLLGTMMAAIFPSLLHQTPELFPDQNLQKLMGIQVASAYVGITVMPPICGQLFAAVSFRWMPVIQMVCMMGVFVCIVYLKCRQRKKGVGYVS